MTFYLFYQLSWLLFLCYGRVHGNLSDYLWNQTTGLQEAALSSTFIQGLSNVSLDPTSFGGFMVQDSIYCFKVKENIDLAISRTSEPSLQQFLKDRSASYDKYYMALFKEWHIQNPDSISLGDACAGYVNHINNVATSMDPYYLVTAMIPCAKLWPWLGKQINSGTGDFGVYNKWVKENLNSDSHGYVKYENIINEAFINGKINQQTALNVYRRSMAGERDFFSSV